MTDLKRLIAESHARQFAGEDYQFVTVSIADANDINYDSDDYTALQSAPDQNCKCRFCHAANWPLE